MVTKDKSKILNHQIIKCLRAFVSSMVYALSSIVQRLLGQARCPVPTDFNQLSTINEKCDKSHRHAPYPLLLLLTLCSLPYVLCPTTAHANTLVWSSTQTDDTQSVAWGDYDGDGDLDQLVGNDNQANRVYRNDGGGTFALVWSSTEADSTYSVAWGDYDGDGDLDQLAGNAGQANRVYRNDGTTLELIKIFHVLLNKRYQTFLFVN